MRAAVAAPLILRNSRRVAPDGLPFSESFISDGLFATGYSAPRTVAKNDLGRGEAANGKTSEAPTIYSGMGVRTADFRFPPPPIILDEWRLQRPV